eukprot:gene6739-9234_t
MADAAPKLDFKMLVVPAIFMLSKNIDFKDENIVRIAQGAFLTVAALVGSIYFFAYTRINSKNDQRKIWVPPKPKPTLPFGLGPPAEPVTAKDYEATNYKDYELKLLQEAAQALLMSCGITLFMSFKFNVHMSLLIQSIMLPLTAYDSVVLKKYVLGITKLPDGNNSLYNELSKEPTKESIEIVQKLAAARAAAASGSAIPPNEPRVEELPDEPKDSSDKKEESKSETGKKETTPATEID